MEPYLGYTIHYFNKRTWELQSACLQVHYTPEDRTGVNLKQALAHTIEDWHLDAKEMVALTTENICLACELLGWRQYNNVASWMLVKNSDGHHFDTIHTYN